MFSTICKMYQPICKIYSINLCEPIAPYKLYTFFHMPQKNNTQAFAPYKSLLFSYCRRSSNFAILRIYYLAYIPETRKKIYILWGRFVNLHGGGGGFTGGGRDTKFWKPIFKIYKNIYCPSQSD